MEQEVVRYPRSFILTFKIVDDKYATIGELSNSNPY